MSNIRGNLENIYPEKLNNNTLAKIKSMLPNHRNKAALRAALGFDIQTFSFIRELDKGIYRIIQWSNTENGFITSIKEYVGFINENIDDFEKVDSRRLILKLGFHRHGGKIYVAHAQLQYIKDLTSRSTYHLITMRNDSGGGIFVTHRSDSLNKNRFGFKVNRTTIMDKSLKSIKEKVKRRLRINENNVHFVNLNLNE